MFEQMVESATYGKDKRRRYFVISAALVLSAAAAILILDLYAANFEIGYQGLGYDELLTPATVKPVAPEANKSHSELSAAAPKAITRATNLARVDESRFVPDKWSADVNRYISRPNQPFTVDSFSGDSGVPGTGAGSRNGAPSGAIDAASNPPDNTEQETPPPPPPGRRVDGDKRPPEVKRLGIVNGIAVELPKPKYPPAAIALNLSDVVQVQVTIDETGNVIAARVVKGNPIFRAAAEEAARRSKFSPTRSEGVPVKVTGLIIYNFVR